MTLSSSSSCHDAKPAGELKQGECYFIRNASGHFLTQGSADHPPTFSDAAQKSLFCTPHTADQKVFVRSMNNGYFSARDNMSVEYAEKPSGREAFIQHFDVKNGSVSLKTSHNTFLGVDPNLGHLIQLRKAPSESQALYFVKFHNPSVYENKNLFLNKLPSNAFHKNTAQKVIWSFWDKGYGKMPAFYQVNVDYWHKILGPSWKIRVTNLIPGDHDNIFNGIIEKADLPAAFDLTSSVMKSDAIRLAILKRHGGVWMDVSNILLKSVDDFCWNEMKSGQVLLCGFYGEGWGNDHLDRKDYFENWFIAAGDENVFIDAWQKVFNLYWDDRIESNNLWEHPLYQGIDISNFQRYGADYRNYLTQHIAFRKAVEQDPIMNNIFKNHMKLYEARDAFFIMTKVGWDESAIAHKLIHEKDENFVNELFQSQSKLMKFPSSMAKSINKLSRDEILNQNHTLGLIYKRLN